LAGQFFFWTRLVYIICRSSSSFHLFTFFSWLSLLIHAPFSLKELDANALKTLSQKVNVIPLIAKADSLTADEKVSFKRTLLQDFKDHQINTFPSSYPEDIDGAEELLVSRIKEKYEVLIRGHWAGVAYIVQLTKKKQCYSFCIATRPVLRDWKRHSGSGRKPPGPL